MKPKVEETPKYQEGDRVQMAAETLKFNPRALSTTGVVVCSDPDLHGRITIRRDNLKTDEKWSPFAWVPLSPRIRHHSGPPESGGRG